MARYLTSTSLIKVLDIAHVYGIDVTVFHNNLPSGDVNLIFVPKVFTNDEHALGYVIRRGEEIEDVLLRRAMIVIWTCLRSEASLSGPEARRIFVPIQGCTGSYFNALR
jgi:hypothetical protein